MKNYTIIFFCDYIILIKYSYFSGFFFFFVISSQTRDEIRIYHFKFDFFFCIMDADFGFKFYTMIVGNIGCPSLTVSNKKKTRIHSKVDVYEYSFQKCKSST
jgi:hypothetical protein